MKFETKNLIFSRAIDSSGMSVTLISDDGITAHIDTFVFNLLFEPLKDEKQDAIRCLNCNVEFPFELFIKRKDVFDFCFCCGDLIKK